MREQHLTPDQFDILQRTLVQMESGGYGPEACVAGACKAAGLDPPASFNGVKLVVDYGPSLSCDNGASLTKIAAECHRAKWQFDFNDETRLPVGQARDMVKRAFAELHRIGDLALKERDRLHAGGPSVSQAQRQVDK